MHHVVHFYYALPEQIAISNQNSALDAWAIRLLEIVEDKKQPYNVVNLSA